MPRDRGGSAWYVGIDAGSIKCGLAALNDDGDITTHLVELKARTAMPDRLVALDLAVAAWLTRLADTGTWCCVVENPVHERGGSTLLASYGVCVAAARRMLRCPVMTPTNTEWKSHTPVGGKAKKDDVMRYSRLLGYEGDSQDIADAVGCADAARALTAKSLGEAA
jgi:Holliday junction resolvasome RuvABC endonuclease subunit